jgi:hypothetical protein
MRLIRSAIVVMLSAISSSQAQPAATPVPVTVDNFVPAETDLYFSEVALKEGGFGKSSIIANYLRLMPKPSFG